MVKKKQPQNTTTEGINYRLARVTSEITNIIINNNRNYVDDVLQCICNYLESMYTNADCDSDIGVHIHEKTIYEIYIDLRYPSQEEASLIQKRLKDVGWNTVSFHPFSSSILSNIKQSFAVCDTEKLKNAEDHFYIRMCLYDKMK